MTEGPRLVGVRNSLVIVGAYYVSSWILVPIWIPVARLFEKRVYLPGEAGLVEARNLIPVVISAVLAGVACGWFIETKRLLVWALACGVFVGVCKWSSGYWYRPPSGAELIQKGVAACVVGVLACAACWVVGKRRRRAAKDLLD